MNEQRYRLFFLYLIDCHNLKIQKKINLIHPSSQNSSVSAVAMQLESVSIDSEKPHSIKSNTSTQSNTVPINLKLKCPVCKRDNFGTKSGLSRHLNSQHPEEKGKEAENGLACAHCVKVCKSSSGLSRHIALAHKDVQ
jgi:uncharacterized C2H2 Zn-finger protein